MARFQSAVAVPTPEAVGSPIRQLRAAAPPPSPLRIALVTEYYYPHLGGICEHIHFLAREARRRGHHVDIITSHIGRSADEPHVIRIGQSVPVYANGSMARVTVGWGLRRQMRDVLRRGRYDVVHAHTPLAPTLPLLAVEEADVPTVGTFHTNFGRSIGYAVSHGYFQRRLDRLAAAIAVSRTAAAACRRYFDADWTIIPNGVDTELFSPDAPPPAGISRDVPTVLFLGRFDPRNEFPTLLAAFRRVRGPRRVAQLVVVGDGPLRRVYRRMAGSDPGVSFVGAVLEGRARYYANSAVYACPTTKASFGITLLEAMACGTPVACSDIAGFDEVVTDGREALMTRGGDVGSLSDALARLLDDPALRERMGAAGRATALRYAWPVVTDQVLAVYARVLARAAAA